MHDMVSANSGRGGWLDRERRDEEEVCVQHVQAGQHQREATCDLEYLPVALKPGEAFQPAHRDGAEQDRNRTAQGESEQQRGAEQWRTDAGGDAQQRDQCGRV